MSKIEVLKEVTMLGVKEVLGSVKNQIDASDRSIEKVTEILDTLKVSSLVTIRKTKKDKIKVNTVKALVTL